MACNEQTEEISELSDVNCNQNNNDMPQTSREIYLPNETANNMNDLTLFDFNSADEVRQRMREVLADSGPNLKENSVDLIPIDVGDQEKQGNNLRLHVMSKLTGTDDLKLDDKKMQETMKLKTLSLSNNGNKGTSRKRPGRPPKAGPPKKLKKRRLSTFYWGKWSNVVFLKRNNG